MKVKVLIQKAAVSVEHNSSVSDRAVLARNFAFLGMRLKIFGHRFGAACGRVCGKSGGWVGGRRTRLVEAAGFSGGLCNTYLAALARSESVAVLQA